MAKYSCFLWFVGIWIGCISLAFQREDICVKKTACSCEFSNGTGFDISETASSFYTTEKFEVRANDTEYIVSSYYYHPCTDELFFTSGLPISDNMNSCDSNFLAICRHTRRLLLQPNSNGIFKLHNEYYEFIGSSNFSSFSPDGRRIIYMNGPSSTEVRLICADDDDHIEVYSLSEPNKIQLSLFSRNACLRQIGSPGRSIGLTLLIIFLSFVILYLVLGIGTKKLLMGATGKDVVPNLTFWTNLPNLVKDCWAFTLNGFKLPAQGAGPATSPDPNSCDISIPIKSER